MAVWSIVKVSELEGAMRLDAEYYQPKYLGIVRTLQALGAVPLSDVAKPVKRRFTPTENPFNYIEIAEVDIGSGATNAVEIAGAEAPSRAQWIVREGDVIVSTVRPARNAVALIGSSEDGFVCSSGFIVLRPFKTSAEFLFAYLKTSIVASLLDRKTTATMYPAVSWDDVLSLPVVLPDSETQRSVNDKVKKSRQKLKDSDSLYIKAEQLLLDEVAFRNLDLSYQLYYTVPYRKAREVGRLDAEHFQPKYNRLIQHLANTGQADLLGNLVAQPIKRGLQPEYDSNGGALAFTEKDLGRYLLNVEGAQHVSEDFWRRTERGGVRKGDVLLYSIGAYIGRANVYLENAKAVASSNITIIRTDKAKCNSVYLALYLNSPLGQLQAEKWTASVGQMALYPSDVPKFVVYLPSMELQQKIADLVTQSWEARQKARQLLEEAKRRVENIVEG